MRIVLDLQAAQASKGNHRQTAIALAQAMIHHRGTHEILIVLSDQFQDTLDPLRAEFATLLPADSIRIWRSPDRGESDDANLLWRFKAAAAICEAFWVSLQPDLVHLTWPFGDGENTPAISLGAFTQTLPTAVTFLSPLRLPEATAELNPDLDCLDAQAVWLRQVDQLKRAHVWLAPSGALCEEVAQGLGLPTGQVINLNAENLERSPDALEPFDSVGSVAPQILQSLEHWFTNKPIPQVDQPPIRRPTLAFFSPLPPAKSGIADYSAELLPELSRHYEIDVIVADEIVTDPWVNANCAIRDVTWFESHAHRYDRVLYHIGNSRYHAHMFDLLARFPGVVMLHDFYLGHIAAESELEGYSPHFWVNELYHAHGYAAVQERFYAENLSDVVFEYPCNLSVLQHALGVMVHSRFACTLVNQWYGESWSQYWGVVPMPRIPAQADRSIARVALGLPKDAFVVCSFGLLGFTKQNHRLLDAWLASEAAKDKSSYLVFVGQNAGDEYGKQIFETIQNNSADFRIQITGWTDLAQFRHYLAAADVAVQLRSSSRGETSAAALDCMNYGLPMVVNACGSMAEFAPEAVWMLPEHFDDRELVDAIDTLWKHPEKRRAIGKTAQHIIHTLHTPRDCADQYANYIEAWYQKAATSSYGLVQYLAAHEATLSDHRHDRQTWLAIADSIAQSLPTRRPLRQLFLDVSVICQSDLKTGIQRVVRSLLLQWIHNPPEGYRVEPVYFTPENGTWKCRYARQYTLKLLDCPDQGLSDDIIEPQAGDIFFGVDLTNNHLIQPEKAGLFSWLRNRGVELYFTVYDLLPILRPDVFPPGTNHHHTVWLETITRMADGVVCISRSVADEVVEWMKANSPSRLQPFKVGWFHLGADIESSVPTKGVPDEAEALIEILSDRPSFLMVGTVEPRKGYGFTLEAFEHLWEKGLNLNLVIVGKQGWMVDALVDKLNNHPQLGKQLFWLAGISDEYLDKIYAACACLIAASEGEGFGLPLIEAAQKKLPIIARSIPVFREVAGDHAFYFDGSLPSQLADSIQQWLTLYSQQTHIRSDEMPWKTWKQSAEQVLENIIGNKWHHIETNDIPFLNHQKL